MKRVLIIVSMLFCFLQAFPQKSADVGIRIGAAVYWGDIEKVDYSKSVTALYGVVGRWNFNKRMSVRGQLVTGNLKAVGEFPNAFLANFKPDQNFDYGGGDVYYIRQSSDVYKFARNIQTAEALFEFNFMDYRIGSLTKDRFTPFLSLGIGVFYSRADITGIASQAAGIESTLILSRENSIDLFPQKRIYRSTGNNETDALAPIIPMGFGIKYNLTKRLGACVELCVRKTFTDNIDNLKDPKRYQDPSPFVGPYPTEFTPNKLINNDWYASLHLSLTWQVWTDRGVCKVNEKNARKSAF